MKKWLFSIITFLSTNLLASTLVLPVFPMEFELVSVKITNLTGNHGGSGVIFRSDPDLTYILTNKHICELVKKEDGMVTTTSGLNARVVKFKESEIHDICLIAVVGNWGINTALSGDSTKFGDVLTVSGHPHLFPLVLADGRASRNVVISVMIGVRKCTEKDWKDNLFTCMFIGGIPNIVNYEALLATTLISPGNSGSGVFNEKGELVGLVFAGSGDLSRGFIVPREYIINFLLREVPNMSWDTYAPQDPETENKEQNFPNTIDRHRDIHVIAIENEDLMQSFGNIEDYRKQIKNPQGQ